MDLICDHPRYADDLADIVGAGMNAITFCKNLCPGFIQDEIYKFHTCPLQIFNICINLDNIIVMRWKKIVTVHLREGQIEPGSCDLLIKDADVSEEFDASNLEPADIIGMVDDPHSIGIRIDDPDLNGCCFQ
jgi:hypothetical protein